MDGAEGGLTVSTATNSEIARRQLRSMPQTRDAVLNLLLIEAGLMVVDDTTYPHGLRLVKAQNTQGNLGMTPELALATVIAKHLRNKG